MRQRYRGLHILRVNVLVLIARLLLQYDRLQVVGTAQAGGTLESVQGNAQWHLLYASQGRGPSAASWCILRCGSSGVLQCLGAYLVNRSVTIPWMAAITAPVICMHENIRSPSCSANPCSETVVSSLCSPHSKNQTVRHPVDWVGNNTVHATCPILEGVRNSSSQALDPDYDTLVVGGSCSSLHMGSSDSRCEIFGWQRRGQASVSSADACSLCLQAFCPGREQGHPPNAGRYCVCRPEQHRPAHNQKKIWLNSCDAVQLPNGEHHCTQSIAALTFERDEMVIANKRSP
jgi:hypothetical protein